MLFWVTAATLTFIACLAVLWPLSRRSGAQGAGAHDVAIYKDQLAEVERDARRGLIAPEQAEAARAEVARRLIKASATSAGGEISRAGAATRWIGLLAVLAIPVVGWAFYGALGSAGMPGEPLAERLAKRPDQNSIEELIARAEKHLAENPDDASGWQVLAPVYLRQDRFADARKAYENAIRLLGSNAERESGLGEALAGEAGGVVTAQSRGAFERALAHDPAEPRALYFLATALAQEGRLMEAAGAWQAMKSSLPPDSPWRNVVEQALAQLAARMQQGRGAGADADAMADAEAMSADERREMIEGMVASLDAKLRDNPADLDGWRRLIRSYVVLGEADKARAALARAVKAFAADAAGLEEINRFAAELGVGRDG